MGKTSIEWTEQSWNPIGGCRKVSPGCKNCYAIRQARRMQGSPIVKIRTRYQGMTVEGPNWSGATFIDEEVLREPLKTRKPTTYFISLSDLFYSERPEADIDRVFAVIALAHWHKFLILTKYHERMRQYIGAAAGAEFYADDRAPARIMAAMNAIANVGAAALRWPLPNVGLGVSFEDQPRADERIPELLQTPAAMRFVSAEPLLGPVDLSELPSAFGIGRYLNSLSNAGVDPGALIATRLDWVIVGGESGPGARPCDVQWIRSIKDQCQAAGVPVFVKQLGALPVIAEDENVFDWPDHVVRDVWHGGDKVLLRDPKGGDPSEWPADLQVRELPAFLGGAA